MGKTAIEYADEVSNPLYARPIGDELVKVGTFCEKPDADGTCKNCWAETLNLRFGNKLAFDKSNRDKIEWMKREKEMGRLLLLNSQKPMSKKFPGEKLVVFCCDTFDIFQPSISDELRDWVFEGYEFCTNLTLLIQTTYAAKMNHYFAKRYPSGLPKHYFIGMSAGTQEFLDKNIAYLLGVKAHRRYIIFEPLLEKVDFVKAVGQMFPVGKTFTTAHWIHLIIAGFESGSKARPGHPDWARKLRDDAVAAGVSFFWKQWGEWTTEYPQGLSLAHRAEAYRHGIGFYKIGKKLTGRTLDGRIWNEFPKL